MADTEVTRAEHKVYKWQERPESCPECDSTCFISSGEMNLTCYHCFLTEGWDTAVVKLAEVRQQTAKAIAQRLRSMARNCQLVGEMTAGLGLDAAANEIEREYEVK